MPEAPYEYKMNVEGIVLDGVSGDPIEGIKVRSSSTHSRADSVLTNAEGEFAFLHSMHSPQKITVEVEDIDGAENGGEYAPQSREVELTDENFYPLDGKGDPGTDWKGNWEVDFELTLKTQEDETD
jgi:putative lipoprotein (rSAM/lipoprotein system)